MDDPIQPCNTFHCKSPGHTVLQYCSPKPVSYYPKRSTFIKTHCFHGKNKPQFLDGGVNPREFLLPLTSWSTLDFCSVVVLSRANLVMSTRCTDQSFILVWVGFYSPLEEGWFQTKATVKIVIQIFLLLRRTFSIRTKYSVALISFIWLYHIYSYFDLWVSKNAHSISADRDIFLLPLVMLCSSSTFSLVC